MCFRSLKEKKDKDKSAKTSAENDHEKKMNSKSKSGNKKDTNKDDTKKDKTEKEEKKHFDITVPNHGGELPDNNPPGVNFINVNRTNFSYGCRFGSFYFVHVTRKSCQNDVLRKKCT